MSSKQPAVRSRNPVVGGAASERRNLATAGCLAGGAAQSSAEGAAPKLQIKRMIVARIDVENGRLVDGNAFDIQNVGEH